MQIIHSDAGQTGYALLSKIKPVTAFLLLTCLVLVIVLWEVNNLNESASSNLARPTRGEVVRIARNPQGAQPVQPYESKQELTTTGGIVMTPMFGLYIVSYMATVFHNLVGVADSQIDVSQFLVSTAMYHLEFVCWHKLFV